MGYFRGKLLNAVYHLKKSFKRFPNFNAKINTRDGKQCLGRADGHCKELRLIHCFFTLFCYNYSGCQKSSPINKKFHDLQKSNYS